MNDEYAELHIDQQASQSIGKENYSIRLSLSYAPMMLGHNKEVALDDRRQIDMRIREVTTQLSHIQKRNLRPIPEARKEPVSIENLQDRLRQLGRLICTTFLPSNVIAGLKGLSCPLIVTTAINDIPWELLHLGEDDYLALQVPVVRNLSGEYKDGALDELNRLFRHRPQPIKALLAADPFGCPLLPMVKTEIQILNNLFQSTKIPIVVSELGVDPHDRLEFLGALADRQFSLVHHAGHGYFDLQDPDKSFIEVSKAPNNTEQISAKDFYDNICGAPVLFFNACESAREEAEIDSFTYLGAKTSGFAGRIISAGALAFVGAQWPILDLTAALFSVAFYQQLIEGDTVGSAMLHARRVIAKGEIPEKMARLFPEEVRAKLGIPQATWANFVLYATPFMQLVPSRHTDL